MAELSNMPHLDENKNTSTLSNHVLESADSLHTSTNNGVKNITSEYTYQSPTSGKGNFSENNCNNNVLSPKNLNILTPETEVSFVKSEGGPVKESLDVNSLNETENSFRTANGSILEEANGSPRDLNGSYLEETSKSQNNSGKCLLDSTLTKVESPTLCLSADTSFQRTEDLKHVGISFNDASSPTGKCSSFTEVDPDGEVTNPLNITSTITSFMGNNPSSPEKNSKRSVKNDMDNTSTVELPSENRTSIEDTPDTVTKSILNATSTLESFPDNQTFCLEDKPDAATKCILDTTSTLEYLPSNQTFCAEDKPDIAKNILNTTSTLESFPSNQISFTGDNCDVSVETSLDITVVKLPSSNQTSFSEDKPNTSVKSVLGTSTLESPLANRTSFTEDKPNTSVKSVLGTSTFESPLANRTSFTEDKPNASVKSVLGTSTLESPLANQTSFTEGKPNTSVEHILGTSTFESPLAARTSFIEDKPNTSVKSILGTSTSESPVAKQISFVEDKPNTSGKSLLSASVVESPVSNRTSFTEDKPDISAKNLLSTSKLESPSGNQNSFVEDKLNTSVKSLSGISALESSAGCQTSFTKEKIGTPVRSLSEVTSTVLSLTNDPVLTGEKLKSPAQTLLETTVSTELSSGNNAAATDGKPDTTVEALMNTTTEVVLSIPDSSTIGSKQVIEANAEVDVSFNKASPLPYKNASFTVDNALKNDSLLSNQEVKTNLSKDLSCSALDQTSVGSCASMGNSDFVKPFQAVETTPKSNIGFRDTSRLIDFSMIEDSSKEFPFKVPSVKIDSSDIPEHTSKDFQDVSQMSNQPIGTTTNVSSEAFEGGLLEEISIPSEDPFGMHKSDPFDLMGMDINTNPKDDFVFKVPEKPVNVENEEFTDAVQFFKDPSSFQFLENIKTSQNEANVPRSSLYIKFDPLHSMFPSQSSEILQALKNETNMDPNKQFNMSARESLGNILISFDSPRLADCRDAQTPVMTAPVKVYTEEELQQHLKVSELTNQEMLLKKQREMEEELVRKEKEMVARDAEKDAKIAQVENLLKVHSKCLEEYALISSSVFEKNKDLHKKMEAIEEENAKLKKDVKTLTDDLQSVETTFADFHKRYEQCKGMLKTYKENEELLRTKLKEQEQAYQVLQDRTQESSEKASSEISSIKRVSEGKIAVLEAQLKKAQLKISSLESDIKHIRIENSKLGGICDDLMEKVGKA